MAKKNYFVKPPAAEMVTTPASTPRAGARKASGAPQLDPYKFKNGNPGGPGRKPGKTLLTRIKEMLTEASRKPDGQYNTRFDDAADAFASKMEEGSFIHTKEYIDREEGKVPQRLADADGKNLKGYVGMPLEGPDAP